MGSAGDGTTFFTEWEETYEAFDQMGLHENLLRGIYGYGKRSQGNHAYTRLIASAIFAQLGSRHAGEHASGQGHSAPSWLFLLQVSRNHLPSSRKESFLSPRTWMSSSRHSQAQARPHILRRHLEQPGLQPAGVPGAGACAYTRAGTAD